MEQWRIEQLHKSGKMPGRIYYALSDRPIEDKYQEQKRNIIDQIQRRADIEKMIEEAILGALDDLLE